MGVPTMYSVPVGDVCSGIPIEITTAFSSHLCLLPQACEEKDWDEGFSIQNPKSKIF
jgi:hypothetical protein